MSSEIVTLVLDAPVSQPARVWRQLWDLAWEAVALRRFPACEAYVSEYFEDLLPDQRSVLMHCDERELQWRFSDFGGAFSAQIGVLAHWFELGLASEYAAVHRVVDAAGGAVAWRRAARIETVLRSLAPLAQRTRGRPMLLTRGRLWPIDLEDDALSIRALTDATDDERSRAAQCWANDQTEDPVHQRFVAASQSSKHQADRAAFDRTLLLRHADRLEATARASNDDERAVLDAIVDAAGDERDCDAASVWLEKHLALARRDDGREALTARLDDERPAVRQLAAATLARAATSAKSSEKAAHPLWIARALASADPVVLEHALSVELDAKRVSDALIAAALAHEAILQRSAAAGEGLARWITAREPRSAGPESLALIERATTLLLLSAGRSALESWLVMDERAPLSATRRRALHAALRTPLAPGQEPWRLAWLARGWSDRASLGLDEHDALRWIDQAQRSARTPEGHRARGALWDAFVHSSHESLSAPVRAALGEASVQRWSDADEALSEAIREDFVHACGSAMHHARGALERARVASEITALCVLAIERLGAQPANIAQLESLHRTVIAALGRTADRWASPPRRLDGCDRCAAALEALAVAWEPSDPVASARARTLAASTDVQG